MLYHNLLPVVLSRVERLAQTDAKYAERCRLENYCFMGEALKSLADRLPALQQHWQVGNMCPTQQCLSNTYRYGQDACAVQNSSGRTDWYVAAVAGQSGLTSTP
jgi:hypothetical protein